MIMNIRKMALTAGLLLSVITVSSQGLSSAYQPGVTQDGVAYWLPKTMITVTVTAQKQTFKPGEFSRYAERYLRLSDVKDKAEEVWTITDVRISTAGVPDKDNLYTLAFPAKGNRPYFELTNDGVISAVNVRRKEQPAQNVQAPAPKQVKKVNPQEYMTEEILMASSTAKMAELTAKEIYNIRESRNNITRGQADFVPTDGESLKFMLESLTAQETALLTLFSGTNETEDITFTINVTPDEALSKQILFRFSSKLGVLPIDNLAGEPVWIDLTDRKMSDNYTIDPDQQKKLQTSKSKKEASFLYYRLPGRAALRIYNNRTTFLEQEIQIAQFGNVETISSSIMGKMADTKITFDTTTGAVLTIE